jgi:hypothetical protein
LGELVGGVVAVVCGAAGAVQPRRRIRDSAVVARAGAHKSGLIGEDHGLGSVA